METTTFLMGKINPALKMVPVKWLKPLNRTLKLNTDGCSNGNPGLAGGGDVRRNNKGDLIMAFSTFFCVCSNNMAEKKAILIGIKWCLDKGYRDVLGYSDS